jgi:AraC family transcriptional regulator of adaptative response/methylated-DNA-[protein]-cysteine methyltransferase
MTPGAFASAEDRWGALARRERAADGLFVYAVVTTGVFCRPSCGSRQPLRRNVEFFSSCEEATRAGFRPCKRCEPTRADPRSAMAARMVEACRLLARGETCRTGDVARAMGLSAYHFHRVFKEHVGVTPQAYRRRVLAERAKAGIRGAPTVTAAIYDAGYSSSSRFYDGAARELGMPPRRARAGAAGERVSYTLRRCSLGLLLVAWTVRGVCDVRFGDAERELVERIRRRFPAAVVTRRNVPPWVDAVVQAVERPRDTNIPLDIAGTAFQESVWRVLRRIPLGETRTYAQVAGAIGAPGAARAVARACAANVLAVVIPCHRVVRADGRSSGYRWGQARKEALIRREARRAGRSG